MELGWITLYRARALSLSLSLRTRLNGSTAVGAWHVVHVMHVMHFCSEAVRARADLAAKAQAEATAAQEQRGMLLARISELEKQQREMAEQEQAAVAAAAEPEPEPEPAPESLPPPPLTVDSAQVLEFYEWRRLQRQQQQPTGAWPYNRPCAQQYVGKSQSCMVRSDRLIVHAPVQPRSRSVWA